MRGQGAPPPFSPLAPRQAGLFKFNSTRGKQACASRARQTRETCVHEVHSAIRARSSAKCSRRTVSRRFVLANEEEMGSVKFA